MAEVIIRHKANIRLAKILEAAYTDYGKTTLNRFLSELEHIEHRLAIQPESYPLERSLMGLKKKYRYCTLKNEFQADILLPSTTGQGRDCNSMGYKDESSQAGQRIPKMIQFTQRSCPLYVANQIIGQSFSIV